jgi:hypothetical protein
VHAISLVMWPNIDMRVIIHEEQVLVDFNNPDYM